MKIVPKIKAAKRVVSKGKRVVRAIKNRPPKIKFYYAYFRKHCKVNERRVLLESFNGKGVSDSAYAVLQEMIAQGLDKHYEIFFGSKNPERDQAFADENHLPIKLVLISSREYAYVIATAKHLLTNTSFPAYFMRRPEQIVVNTWHGTPLKTLGKQMRQGMQSMFLGQHAFLHSSWLTFPNEYTRDAIMRDYNLDQLYTGKVAMLGYPRNAVFLQGGKSDLRERYDLKEYTTYAYMPTWRGKSSQAIDTTGYVDTAKMILSHIDQMLADDERMYVNFHPMVAPFITLDTYEHILPFPKDVATYDFLSQIDVLITDYSSVMFDYALTRNPVILFTYDEEEYLRDRGFYFPLSELPFPKVATVEELMKLIRAKSYALSDEDQKAFEERFLKHDSANNARDVLALLLGEVPQGTEVIDYSHNLAKTWGVVDARPQKSLADINGIFQSTKRDEEVILLKRAGFGAGKSTHLVENYSDGYNFVFVTQALPRTFIEDVTKRFWRPTVERLAERERKRVLGDLHTVPEPRTTYLAGNPQSSFSASLIRRMGASYTLDGTKVTVRFSGLNSESELSAGLEPTPVPELKPVRLLLVTKRTIRWIHDITEEERTDGEVTFDVMEPLCNPDFKANVNTRVKVCLLVKGPESDEGHVEELVVGLQRDEYEYQNERFDEPILLDLRSVIDRVGVDEKGRTGIPLIDKARDANLSVTTYSNINGVLSILFTHEHREAESYMRARAFSVRTPGQQTMSFRIRIPKGSYTVKDVVIRNRLATSDTTYSLPFTLVERTENDIVEAGFDPHGVTFDGIYWDLFLVVEGHDRNIYDLPCYTTDSLRHSFYFRNLQCVLPDGDVVFPYVTVGCRVALCHRKLEKSDTLAQKGKEWIAFAIYLALQPYWKRRRIWLVYEKFCSLAQDNGYAFFKYCMEEAPEEAHKHVYYVIKKDEPEFAKVAQYGRNVIDFMSFRHILYALSADIYVGSDAKSHLYQWRPKNSIIRRFVYRHKVFFLQHGVTALKRVDYLFGKKGSTPMTYFLTTSRAEQDIVLEHFGYNERHAPILGFSRWDLLEDTSDASHPTVLLMPTWRQWLEDVDDQTFLASDYFNAYSDLIKDDRIIALLERVGATVKFFIHPKMSEQLKHFQKQSDRVELIEMGTRPLNELIMECSLLVTDYSSVSWDVLYLNKPVLYYQFDQQQYSEEVGSYIDLNTQLPGDVCHDLDALVASFEKLVEDGFKLSDENKAMAETWFDFKDDQNRRRTYEYLLSEGY